MNRPPGTEIRSVPGKGSPGQQTGIKMLHDTALRSQVEVDHHIAAENDVEPFLEQHPAVVTEVGRGQSECALGANRWPGVSCHQYL
jgi:hypothetical protein